MTTDEQRAIARAVRERAAECRADARRLRGIADDNMLENHPVRVSLESSASRYEEEARKLDNALRAFEEAFPPSARAGQ